MKFIPYEVKTGKENMQIDSDLLDNAILQKTKEPVFRLYGWSPACISLGRNQKDDFIDTEFLAQNNIDVVRRLTGGRALLHDNEITYSFVCPTSYLKNGENVVESYKEISQILIDAFAKLGIELDFGGEKKYKGHKDYCMLVSTGADLCYKGKKLIGSAQFRKTFAPSPQPSPSRGEGVIPMFSEMPTCVAPPSRGEGVIPMFSEMPTCVAPPSRGEGEKYILQHGSILYDYDRELLEKIFKEDTSSITTIREINPNITKDDIIELLSNINKHEA